MTTLRAIGTVDKKLLLFDTLEASIFVRVCVSEKVAQNRAVLSRTADLELITEVTQENLTANAALFLFAYFFLSGYIPASITTHLHLFVEMLHNLRKQRTLA